MLHSIGMCGLSMVFACLLSAFHSPANAQGLWGNESRRDRSADTERAEIGQAEIAQSKLYWEALDTHLTVIVSIHGKDFKWEKRFTEGTAPEFNAIAEEIEPGIYTYQVTFIPNEVEEEKAALNALKTERKDLVQQYEEAVEAGDADTVKRLYWQANEVRKQATAMSREQMQKNANDYDYITKRGQIIAYGFGDISKYDRKQARKEQQEKMMEERRLNPPPREEDEQGRDGY